MEHEIMKNARLPQSEQNLFIQLLILLLLCNSGGAVQAEDVIMVSKSRQELYLLEDEHVIKHFHIAYGKGGAGSKQRSGDKKTPVGTYRIIDFKQNSQFYIFMQLDYPNVVDAWYGYHNKLISATEFKSIVMASKTGEIPPQDTELGGYIGIHGLGEISGEKLKIHNRHNWTNGCIAMTNEEITELLKYVGIGTKVVIRE